MTSDNNKSHTKTGFHLLFKRYILKNPQEWGVQIGEPRIDALVLFGANV